MVTGAPAVLVNGEATPAIKLPPLAASHNPIKTTETLFTALPKGKALVFFLCLEFPDDSIASHSDEAIAIRPAVLMLVVFSVPPVPAREGAAE